MMDKYYLAYDERYKTIHQKKKSWMSQVATPIVLETINKYQIKKTSNILEIGCGEGRDAIEVLNAGFDLLATDVSQEAISYCKNIMPLHEKSFMILDCLKDDIENKYDFIYAIALIHMLVLDEDRNNFYQFIKNHLKEDGIALICSMGDGENEFSSDIEQAFSLQERLHEEEKIFVAATSCRMVSFKNFEKELKTNNLQIIEKGITSSEPNFNSLMYVIVKR